ncbi:MAG: QueT transporter family protein [Candidatus Bathyarchaeota archaeon]|nr:QueT transporter family protein [Candidatus Bathyarchaeota archaeon]
MQNRVKTKIIAFIAMYAALYAALVVVLGDLSFGLVNIRIADAMLAVVPLVGFAGVLGHTLGVFIGNVFSTVGLVDLLNTIPSFVMAFVVYYVYKRTRNDYSVLATCIAYSLVLGTTVGWMLSAVFDMPLLPTIGWVMVGNLIVTTLIGWPMFKLLKRTGIFEKWFPIEEEKKK